jgi:carboxyl-terminal processing protease
LPPAHVAWVHSPPPLPPQQQGHVGARVLALIFTLVLVFAVGFAAGGSTGSTPLPDPSVVPSGVPGPGSTVPPYAPSDFGVFWEALKTVKDNFVDPSKTTDENLTWGAIRGMVDALGDTGHSIFLTPEQVKAEQNSLNGHVSGIGVVVDSRTAPPEIVSVIPGSPAAAAGLKAGDLILAVDGTSTDTLAPDQVVHLIRGEPGTTVVITIRHTGDTQPMDVSIVRADVAVPASSWAMVPGTTIADIHVHQFSNGAGDTAREQIQAALDAGADRIVLDLRGNPGGYVTDAIKLASQFLPEGAVVYQERDRSGTVKSIKAEPGGIAVNAPLVVLIDQGSASASEIVSGAIKGNNRGPLVGEKTFGTGTVLNTFTLSDGSAIRLGVLEWLTPTGETIFGKGITPDVVVALPTDGVLLEPDVLGKMSAAEFQASKDTQLQKAVELVTAQP